VCRARYSTRLAARGERAGAGTNQTLFMIDGDGDSARRG
jgi:hypothetical protein